MTDAVYSKILNLSRPDNVFQAALCCGFVSQDAFTDLVKYLTVHEKNYFSTLKFKARSSSYLLGRYMAKRAVHALTGDNMADISVQPGVFTQPVVMSAESANIQVSITHCDDIGAALAYPEAHPMGIDIEKIDAAKREVLRTQITDAEQNRAMRLPVSYDTALTLLWTVKEGLSKILRTGLMTPFFLYEVAKFEVFDAYTLSYFSHFHQYKAMSFTLGDHLCSIVYPLKTKLELEDPLLLADLFEKTRR
jgi:4'-phosphopantetheinyl transferase EntD